MPQIITTQIAPNLCDIHYSQGVFTTDFNRMHIQYKVHSCASNISIDKKKEILQMAIVMSSNPGQIQTILKCVGLRGELKVWNV